MFTSLAEALQAGARLHQQLHDGLVGQPLETTSHCSPVARAISDGARRGERANHHSGACVHMRVTRRLRWACRPRAALPLVRPRSQRQRRSADSEAERKDCHGGGGLNTRRPRGCGRALTGVAQCRARHRGRFRRPNSTREPRCARVHAKAALTAAGAETPGCPVITTLTRSASLICFSCARSAALAAATRACSVCAAFCSAISSCSAAVLAGGVTAAGGEQRRCGWLAARPSSHTGQRRAQRSALAHSQRRVYRLRAWPARSSVKRGMPASAVAVACLLLLRARAAIRRNACAARQHAAQDASCLCSA
jgi:hypothetical protein